MPDTKQPMQCERSSFVSFLCSFCLCVYKYVCEQNLTNSMWQNFMAIMGRVLLKELGALNQTNDSWDGLGEQLQTASGGSLLASELLWSCALVS